jgi:hypothetical protein
MPGLAVGGAPQEVVVELWLELPLPAHGVVLDLDEGDWGWDVSGFIFLAGVVEERSSGYPKMEGADFCPSDILGVPDPAEPKIEPPASPAPRPAQTKDPPEESSAPPKKDPGPVTPLPNMLKSPLAPSG